MDTQRFGDPTQADFRLAISPFYLMAHADFRYHEDMEVVLARRGVSKSIYRVLTVLREFSPINIGQLAERALMKRSTASRIIDRMVEQRLAEARPAPQDTRFVEVSLTPEGADLLNSLTPVVARQFARAVQGLEPEELTALVGTLRRIVDNLGKLAIE
ncbi:MAG: MarR family transcriptional regulator [Sphingobium sp.]